MKDLRVILRYTYRNHLGELKDYREEFVSFLDFRNYLRWTPERAMAIGYIPVDPEKMKSARSSDVRLSICFREEETSFIDAREFINFLQDHAEIAKMVQYHPSST